jgi:TfoX/Sxy family transcriptional regulator of competence genes
MAYDEALAVRVRQALRQRTDITERKMFGGLSFLRDGRMCCGIVGNDLVVRVLDSEMPSNLPRAHVRPMDFTSKPLRGFVYVEPDAITTDDELRQHARQESISKRAPSTLVRKLRHKRHRYTGGDSAMF